MKDDGNDAAHDGTLDTAAAEDLLDFTIALLEQLYTRRGKLAEAKQAPLCETSPIIICRESRSPAFINSQLQDDCGAAGVPPPVAPSDRVS